ncbi:hypothetical protein ACWD4X_32050 [Streptomyces termitum]
MDPTRPVEARLDETGNVLVAPPGLRDHETVRGFFGTVVTPEEFAAAPAADAPRTVYLCGDPHAVPADRLRAAARVLAVRDLCPGLREDPAAPWTTIGSGRVPLRVHGAGVHYRRFFAPEDGHFQRIRAEHAFQSLTESTKPGTAHRSGVYLTPVTRDGDALRFRLLRCSTNLSGPTEGFRPTDTEIVGAVAREADTLFRDHAPLNHVLAQTYHNTRATEERRQTKARIASHADKTKDMPAGGIMAFCTFYDGPGLLEEQPGDPFGLGLRGTSGLTVLRFRRKEGHTTGPERFEVTLYPGSVFFMPLSTNRLYTHEVRPSALDAAVLPTRLGYVVRCSAAEAVHEDGHTYLDRPGGRVRLEPPTETGMAELRALYAEENRTTGFVDYGERFPFSMNAGDYRAPRP